MASQSRIVAQVYGFIIDVMLQGYLADADLLAHEWNTSVEEVLLLGVRSVPSHVLNLCIGSECLTKFGCEVLRAVPGFIMFSRTSLLCDCHEYGKPCWCDEHAWMLDIDRHLHPHGLLMPETDQRGRAVNLWVFRHRKDQKPFRLRARKLEAA